MGKGRRAGGACRAQNAVGQPIFKETVKVNLQDSVEFHSVDSMEVDERSKTLKFSITVVRNFEKMGVSSSRLIRITFKLPKFPRTVPWRRGGTPLPTLRPRLGECAASLRPAGPEPHPLPPEPRAPRVMSSHCELRLRDGEAQVGCRSEVA